MDLILEALSAYAETDGVDADKLQALADAAAAIVDKDPDSPETAALLDAILALVTTEDAEDEAPAGDPPVDQTKEETV